MTNNKNLSFLPDPGPGRKWVIDLNPKSQTKPMVLKLIERYKRGSRGASTVLNSEYVVADQKAISNAAQDILDRIGDYEKFVGEYDHADPS
jgi:hypothetical protein